MAELSVPQIDFSSLGQLPQVYKQARDQQLVQQTLANLGTGQNGQIDPTPLLRSGNLSLAQLGLNIQNHQQDAQRQAARDKIADQHWQSSFGLQQSNAARAQANADREWNYDQTEERAQQAEANGLDRNSPEGRAFILTGKLPSTNSTGPKAIPLGGALVSPTGQVLFQNKPQGNLDDQTVQDMADQYLAGDRTVFQNLGRGAQGAENVVRLRKAVSDRARTAGLDPKGIVQNFNEQAGNLAGQRAVGTRAANISLAANEANNMIGIALNASDRVPRTQWMPINKAIQAYQKGASSPELASFVAATNSLVNAYVRAVSPSGVPTDSMRQHAYDMLNSAQGPEAYKAVVSTMRKEMNAALSAPSQVRKELRGQTESQGNGADEMLQHARDAISQGAPRAAVIQRLQQAGIDPGAL